MSYGGTYWRESSEKQPFSEARFSQQARPPVRVTVSYPLSDEWDGRPPKKWYDNYYYWTLTMILLIVGSGTYLLMSKMFPTKPISTTLRIKQFQIPELQLVNATQGLVESQIFKYNNEKTKNYDNHEKLEFFKKELSKIKSNKDYFKDIGIPYKSLTLHETSNIERSINNYLQNRINCLQEFVNIELSLSSYDFQKNLEPNRIKKRHADESSDFQENITEITHFEVNAPCTESTQQLQKLKEEFHRKPTIVKMNNSLLVYGKVAILEEIKQILDNDKEITMVTIIASILYLDTNITSNIDMAIFAKKWKFVKKPIKFDLTGASAIDLNIDAVDGHSGKSGSNGGYFLAVGLENHESLILHLNGGNATAGHRGQDGQNAIPNILPNPLEFGRKYCTLPLDVSQKNVYGEEIQRHVVFDNRACAIMGAMGGYPGIPGKGGKAIFIGTHNQTVLSGSDGFSAKKGEDGMNGTAVEGKCYYIAYKIIQGRNTIKWLHVNKPICHEDKVYKLPMIPQEGSFCEECKMPEENYKDETVFQDAIETFSEYAREKLMKGDREFFPLLQKIESSPFFGKTTTPEKLYEIYNQIESKFDNIEIYQSFAEKVRMAKTEKNKVALNYLQAVIWSKILILNKSFGVHYVVNVEEYLKETLDWAESLKIDRIKLLQNDNGPPIQIIQKLNETKEILNNLDNYDKSNDTEVQFLHLTIKVVLQLCDILTEYLQNGLQVKNSMVKLQNILYQMRENECFGNEHCYTEKTIYDSFFNIRTNNLINSIEESLKTLDNELCTSLGKTFNIKRYITNVREAVRDFSSLLFRIRQTVNEQEIRKCVVEITNEQKMDKMLIEMEEKILKNVLFERYQKALDAYKQLVFPDWITIETLTADATPEDIKRGIETIIRILKTNKSTIQVQHSRLRISKFNLHSAVSPFFTWLNSDYHYVIRELLQGRRVNLRAAITDSVHGLTKQAVKFKVAEFLLEGIPSEITKNFEVWYAHSGFSHFSLNGTIITIIGPQFELTHSLHYNINDQVDSFNKVYQIIKDSDPFLSPFTTWAVQLRPLNNIANFQDFQPYWSKANVHLVGHGVFFM